MCIGTPMRVQACADGMAWAEGRGQRAHLNMLMVGEQPAGTWVLAFQGAALRTMSADEAAQTDAALDALEAALTGRGNGDEQFRDLIDREPTLPAHLRPPTEESPT